MKGKDNVLIISLGRSPAVVPETLDALSETNIYIKRTYLVTTGDETIVNCCIPLLVRDFKLHYEPRGMELRPHSCMLSKDDIHDEQDNLELMLRVGAIFKQEKQSNIYISMAGGRKTMSAAMALLAQIYGARAITHVLVPPELEREGNIHAIKERFEGETEAEIRPELEKILHPRDKRLIFFPVIGISWMLDDMITALKGKDNRNPEIDRGEIRPSVASILQENGLLDEQGKTTQLGEELLKLLDDIEKIPEPFFEEPRIQFKTDEHAHAPRGYKKFVQKLQKVNFIKAIRGIKFVHSPKTRINQLNSEGTIQCQYSDGDKAYVMEVETTARTRGEVEMVRLFMEREMKNLATRKKR